MRVRRMLLGAFGGLYHDVFGRLSRLGAAAVIFDADDRVFLVQHSYGRRNWELPGGGRKANESMEQTVHRELREETGVELVIERLSGVYYQPHIDHYHFVFLCHVTPDLRRAPTRRKSSRVDTGLLPPCLGRSATSLSCALTTRKPVVHSPQSLSLGAGSGLMIRHRGCGNAVSAGDRESHSAGAVPLAFGACSCK